MTVLKPDGNTIDIEISHDAAARNLFDVRTQRLNLVKFVQRKKKIRDSERAMWLAGIYEEIASLDLAMMLLRQTPERKETDDNDATG